MLLQKVILCQSESGLLDIIDELCPKFGVTDQEFLEYQTISHIKKINPLV